MHPGGVLPVLLCSSWCVCASWRASCVLWQPAAQRRCSAGFPSPSCRAAAPSSRRAFASSGPTRHWDDAPVQVRLAHWSNGAVTKRSLPVFGELISWQCVPKYCRLVKRMIEKNVFLKVVISVQLWPQLGWEYFQTILHIWIASSCCKGTYRPLTNRNSISVCFQKQMKLKDFVTLTWRQFICSVLDHCRNNFFGVYMFDWTREAVLFLENSLDWCPKKLLFLLLQPKLLGLNRYKFSPESKRANTTCSLCVHSHVPVHWE